jgi:ubiquitin-protein ligase
LIYVIFSDDYPTIPPIIRFHTPIYHLNITADGQISHDIFDISWSNVISMYEIFHTLNKLLVEPDLRNAISEENVHLYEKDRATYELRVSTHIEKYALKNLNQIKCTYRLEET